MPDATKVDDGSSPTLSFDAVKRFVPKRSRIISSSPISTGSFVSEILSEKGGTISLEGYVSDNPVIIYEDNVIDSTSGDTRAHAAYTALKKLYESADTVTIQYKLDPSLDNYILTSYEPILMPSNSIGFRLEFQEVRFAEEQTVNLAINMSTEKQKEASTGETSSNVSKEQVTDADSRDVTMTERLIEDVADTLQVSK